MSESWMSIIPSLLLTLKMRYVIFDVDIFYYHSWICKLQVTP